MKAASVNKTPRIDFHTIRKAVCVGRGYLDAQHLQFAPSVCLAPQGHQGLYVLYPKCVCNRWNGISDSYSCRIAFSKSQHFMYLGQEGRWRKTPWSNWSQSNQDFSSESCWQWCTQRGVKCSVPEATGAGQETDENMKNKVLRELSSLNPLEKSAVERD